MKISLTVLLLFFAMCNYGQFIHPGMLHPTRDLEFLKTNVESGKEPWISLWKDLCTSEEASASWIPRARKVINVGFYSHPDIGATDFKTDANAAYTLALRYYVTKDPSYAKKSVQIINAWSYTLDSITGDNKKLCLGIAGVKFLNAAEIMKYTYTGWKKKDQKAFKKMILTTWYPLLKDFMPAYNGNWDFAISQTMMCIGIFCNDKDIYHRAYEHCLDGETNGSVNHYINDWGQCQESGRDQGHVQMGLGFLATVCEIAWKQGDDLYTAWSSRLAKGYEYTAKYLLGGNVPYVQYINFQGKALFTDSISSGGRGRFSPVYEMMYHHYHDRMGMELPYTKSILGKSRPEELSNVFMPWASLMHQGYPD